MKNFLLMKLQCKLFQFCECILDSPMPGYDGECMHVASMSLLLISIIPSKEALTGSLLLAS